MYAFLLKHLPKPAALAIIVAGQAAAIVLVVLLADKPFGQFIYMRL